MMAPQELTKVPTSERARRTDECGSVGGKMTKGKELKLNLLKNRSKPCRVTNNFSGDRKEKNPLILQDGFHHCLGNDKAVWVHHAILSTNLSCAHKSKERWAQTCILTKKRQQIRSSHLPTMSFLICSVMGIGLTASGEMNLVKMVTASFSIPEKETSGSPLLHIGQLLQGTQSNSLAREEEQRSSSAKTFLLQHLGRNGKI